MLKVEESSIIIFVLVTTIWNLSKFIGKKTSTGKFDQNTTKTCKTPGRELQETNKLLTILDSSYDSCIEVKKNCNAATTTLHITWRKVSWWLIKRPAYYDEKKVQIQITFGRRRNNKFMGGNDKYIGEKKGSGT